MVRHRIPTAHHASFTDLEEARAYLEEVGAPIVIKADGLAAGKGVVVAQTLEEAHAAVTDMLGDRRFGDAGARVVIEEFLTGEEASFIAMVGVDGAILPLATSQDHKARDDGDQGPNTGGMGAYSPAPVVTDAIAQRVINEVLRPVIEGMREEGVRYTGFLYAGLMIGPDGTPKVLEFNCRFGDPETQPILFRLKSDLLLLIEAALEGKLAKTKADWDPRPAVGVVMAAGGYPGDYRKGDEITGLPVGAASAATPDVQGLPRRHRPQRARPDRHPRRPRALRRRHRRHGEGRPGRSLSRGGPDQIRRRPLPPRHRLPRHRPRPVGAASAATRPFHKRHLAPAV